MKYSAGQLKNGYSAEYVMGLTDEELAKQMAFFNKIKGSAERYWKKPLEALNPGLVLQYTQLEAEKFRRDGVCP